MIALSTADAIAGVRKNLDEILPNDSEMYIPSSGENNENPSMDDIIKRNLPEAVNAIHLSAPATSLVGKAATFVGNAVSADEDGVLTFAIDDAAGVLRLVQFLATDSGVVATGVLEEASPEGRKQLDKFIRGRYDRPRIVRLQDDKNKFRYYSLLPETVDGTTPSHYIEICKYLPEMSYSSSATSYDIDSAAIRQNVVDYLTGLVLETYSQVEKAKIFYARASIFH